MRIVAHRQLLGENNVCSSSRNQHDISSNSSLKDISFDKTTKITKRDTLNLSPQVSKYRLSRKRGRKVK